MNFTMFKQMGGTGVSPDFGKALANFYSLVATLAARPDSFGRDA